MSSAQMSFGSPAPNVAWMLGGDGLPSGVGPGRTALVWPHGSRTYAELRGRARSLAAALRDRGLVAGDRVACVLFNRGEIYEIYFACAYAGLTFAPLNFRLSEGELHTVIADAGARVVFAEAELAPRVRAAVERLSEPADVIELDAQGSGAAFDALASGAEIAGPYGSTNPQLLLFSSGTTGRPKGICLTHRNILSYALVQELVFPEMSCETVSLIVPPMFNTAGINELSTPTLLAGGTLALLPSRNWSARKMADAIDLWQATHAIVFPTMITPLLAADEESSLDLASLRFAAFGGEQVPAALLERFRARWPHVRRGIGYGLTEGGLISFIHEDEIDERPGSVGRSVPFQTWRIADRDGRALAPGEIGEISTASDFVTSGYWNAPTLTEELIIDGWLRTGDLGHVDEDGYLYIEGRVRDLIISKGQNVYPAEIEQVLLTNRSVAKCAVIGVPDDAYGEAVCAVIVTRPGAELNAQQYADFVAERIASYKKPRYVVFRDELPTSANNKVLKRDLVADVTAALGR